MEFAIISFQEFHDLFHIEFMVTKIDEINRIMDASNNFKK